MARWFFEPGHTAAEFCVRHMMVTYVRGHFKNVRGVLTFDPTKPRVTSVEATIDAAARGLPIYQSAPKSKIASALDRLAENLKSSRDEGKAGNGNGSNGKGSRLFRRKTEA